ncbi:nuclear transport factor 2 family protein [Streptomyces mirabilis]|uniref:nuclear transport factor 2 family protein n=2 Tax=Streptomyces mirabilis TaxID=68239 RepID=UPI00332567BA
MDAMLDHPRSGDRFRGRETIAAQRGGHPADRHFPLRITGHAHVWVSECVTIYDGAPSYAVTVMGLVGHQVGHETQYFAALFGTPAWRAALAEPTPGRTIEEA